MNHIAEERIKAYRQMLDACQDHMPEQERIHIENTIEANTIMGNASDELIAEMFNTGFFNEFCKAYTEKACLDIRIPKEQIKEILDEMDWLFGAISIQTIQEQLEGYRNIKDKE